MLIYVEVALVTGLGCALLAASVRELVRTHTWLIPAWPVVAALLLAGAAAVGSVAAGLAHSALTRGLVAAAATSTMYVAFFVLAMYGGRVTEESLFFVGPILAIGAGVGWITQALLSKHWPAVVRGRKLWIAAVIVSHVVAVVAMPWNRLGYRRDGQVVSGAVFVVSGGQYTGAVPGSGNVMTLRGAPDFVVLVLVARRARFGAPAGQLQVARSIQDRNGRTRWEPVNPQILVSLNRRQVLAIQDEGLPGRLDFDLSQWTREIASNRQGGTDWKIGRHISPEQAVSYFEAR